MDNLNAKLGSGLTCLFIFILWLVLTFTFLAVLFPRNSEDWHVKLCMAIGFIFTLCICFAIDRILKAHELQTIRQQQESFSLEFNAFKEKYRYLLFNDDALCKIIDETQIAVFEKCASRPSYFAKTKDFKIATYRIIEWQLYCELDFDHSIHHKSFNSISKFHSEILANKDVFSDSECIQKVSDFNRMIKKHNLYDVWP